jgi:hypothetical protein
MKEEWLMPGAIVPVNPDTTKALVDEIKRLIGVIGGMALQQAEKQEPVAYIDHRIHGWPDCIVTTSEPPHTSPLYTTPQPQREWVGLTPDEVFGIADQHPVEGFDPDIMAYTRAIEAKLRSKNT